MHARQLHHDAVQALLLNHRLGHAEFVDTVVQRGDVLFQGLVLHPATGFGFELGVEQHVAALSAQRAQQIGELVAQQDGRGIGGGLFAEHDIDLLAVARNTAVANVFLAQQRAQVPCQRFGFFAQRGLHVDLQHEVHAATQIQTQVHGCGAQAAQPHRRASNQVERDDVRRGVRVRVERAL